MIDRETVRKILIEDLDMRKVCAKMVPKNKSKEVTICQDLFAKNSWILLHANAPDHDFLATKQMTVLEHPGYSQDLAPMTFLFPKINEILKGRHFDDIDYIRSNTTAAQKAIPQNQFQNCFEG